MSYRKDAQTAMQILLDMRKTLVSIDKQLRSARKNNDAKSSNRDTYASDVTTNPVSTRPERASTGKGDGGVQLAPAKPRQAKTVVGALHRG